MSRISRLRHARYTSVDRIEHRRKLNAFLADRAADLATTGAAKTFALTATAYGIKGASIFTFTGQPSEGDSVSVGGVAYVAGTDFDISVDVAATSPLTGSGNPSDGDTVTIGSDTYTFKTALSVGPAVAFEVLIGAALIDTLTNLAAAVNADTGAGTLYGTGTTANADVDAGIATISTLPLTATVAGAAGNSIVSTESSTVLSFADTTFDGGVDATVAATRGNLAIALEANENIDITTLDTDKIVATAKTVGVWAAGIATVKSGTFGSWNHATLYGGVDPTNDVTISSHGFTGGEGPFVYSTSGAAPGGLFAGASYWIKEVVDSSTVKLSTKLSAPVSRITSVGSGTHTLTKAETVTAMLEYLKKDGPAVLAAATDVDTL